MYGYDTEVPLIFYGTGIAPQCVGREVDMIAVAPTLASLLGVRKPAAAEGSPLPEVTGEGRRPPKTDHGDGPRTGSGPPHKKRSDARGAEAGRLPGDARARRNTTGGIYTTVRHERGPPKTI